MKSRNALFTALALGLALTAPAFAHEAAQDPSAAPTAQPQTAAPADAAAQQTQPTDPATAQTTSPTAPASPAAPAPGEETKKVTWSDLDTDKDGKLSKTEVAPVQALTQVFDDADADKDGALTPDEYKAYVAKNQAEAAAPPQG